ncbi:hypothetical protein NEFER03_1613 [Nematocida sp. LUAm3]|nr:hypothetical protein NEFER03_1613 [Nematocida sp. LUAm3]KAI5176127.1 hypothetical protein NEFER02_1948 [Nematocida sp. LUAm2]KAI5179015.1 hypothetical protein NEFER01_1891 [Nematocida sp. LUAm1]
MDIQERAALVSARIKASTYPGDKVDALREAEKIAKEDSLIAGTYFLDSLLVCMRDPHTMDSPLLYAALNEIFLGSSGREFIDIFCKQEEASNYVILSLLDKKTDHLEEKQKTLKAIISRKTKSISSHLIRSPEQNNLFEEAFDGRELVIETLISLFRDSSSLKRILIFNGFIEAMMRISEIPSGREKERLSLVAIAEMLSGDQDAVSYFLTLPWSSWMKKMKEKHPHHLLKIIYLIGIHEKHKKNLFPIISLLLELKDLFSIYALTLNSPETSSHIAKTHHKELLPILKQFLSSSCSTRWNTAIGIFCNISIFLPKNNTEENQNIISVKFFSNLLQKNHSNPIEESEVLIFLYKIPELHSLSYNEQLLYLKTSLILLEHSPLLLSREILYTIRNALEEEEKEYPLKVLLSLWLLSAYEASTQEEKEVTHFKGISDQIFPQSENILQSIGGAHKHSHCLRNECRRCLYAEATASSSPLPRVLKALSDDLWLPESSFSSILRLILRHVSNKDTQQREVTQKILQHYVPVQPPVQQSTQSAQSAPVQPPAPPKDAPHTSKDVYDL